MDEHESRLNDLERELTLLSRHFLGSRGPRIGQTLERSAYVLLTRMETSAPMTLKELAHTFQVDVSTISRQVNAMLRAGLVERIADPDGGIARKYRPTEAGIAQLHADRAISLEGTGRLVEAIGWNPGTTERFLTLLTELNQGVEKLEVLSGPGSRGGGTPPAG
ncbi:MULTISPECIES: MarR family winged helix-turn-helix transcriptional regulator [unclassified Streptomyces]|uniref:MarR family winged helix-turn-helix transcriptional regulator n=1 Tax=unclassified Streptomyces TaxID=2593676 RepID=UPI001660E596|nr:MULTISPECIES: MarR family transcriptional regulator [unclassified Streptomyces]MBD0709983.1 MarR family transcriptional regulator [Streptomyces sp. CBMA291]MBD0714280.1 MarR family transcriptional regulator [Streptomyces sp. CBMA370]